MPVVSDFIRVIGDGAQTITNASVAFPFSTGGRNSNHEALLVFSLRGLNSTVQVRVNDQVVGSLTPLPTQNHWTMQQVYMGGSVLNSGNNELRLEGESDNFAIKDITCFFGQSA